MKTPSVQLLAVSLLLLIPVRSDAATILISGPTQSESAALINGSFADNNYGTYGLIPVGKNVASQTVRSLLRFDLSTVAGLTVLSGSITLTLNYATNTAFTNQTVSLYRVAPANALWATGTANGTPQNGSVSWSYRSYSSTAWAGSAGLSSPGTDYVATPLGSFQMNKTDPSGTKYTINFADVSFFGGWINDASTNAGFLLSSSGLEAIGAAPNFISTQGGLDSEKPVLTLVTVPEPGTNQLMLFWFCGLVGYSFIKCLTLKRRRFPNK